MDKGYDGMTMKRGLGIKTSPIPTAPSLGGSRARPVHVAIIMDGNGRWAKARGFQRIEGHKAGIEAVRRAVSAASNLGSLPDALRLLRRELETPCH